MIQYTWGGGGDCLRATYWSGRVQTTMLSREMPGSVGRNTHCGDLIALMTIPAPLADRDRDRQTDRDFSFFPFFLFAFFIYSTKRVPITKAHQECTSFKHQPPNFQNHSELIILCCRHGHFSLFDNIDFDGVIYLKTHVHTRAYNY